MRGTAKAVLKLSRYSTLLSQLPTNPFLGPRTLSFTTISTTTITQKETESKHDKDSKILEQFRLRKLKGSSKTQEPRNTPPSSASSVLSFTQLGLSEEVGEAVKEMGISIPSEIHCVGIPAILDRKSVVLSSNSDDPFGCLTYLLPLIQLLKKDEKLSGERPKKPRAMVLCTSQELADEVFRVAKFVLHSVKLKPAIDESDASIGLLVGTPDEVLQLIEEGDVIPSEIEYLVYDGVDATFDHNFGLDIHKLISPLKESVSKSNNRCLQTVLVSSTMTKMLPEHLSSVVEHLERSHAGEVAAMLLEVDQIEALNLLESPDALRLKITEAMESLSAS
ncbi:hypothetical protein UlMin_036315 [Ulmus minor]